MPEPIGAFVIEGAREDGVRIVWADHAASRRALGVDTTRAWLQAKLDRPGVFRAEPIRQQLADLDDGRGPTYFDLVLDAFAGHPGIRLELR